MPDLNDPLGLQAHLQTLFQDPTLFPDSFKSWLPNHLSINPPDINIDQINGYQQNSASAAQTVQVEETTGSVAYTNLTTPGPTLTKLGDGTFVVAYGCSAKISNSNTRARANIAINGVANDTITPQIYTSNSGGMVGCSATAVVALKGGVSGNTITLLYSVAVTGNTGTFGARYLSAQRISD
jgi:hypothetical protein